MNGDGWVRTLIVLSYVDRVRKLPHDLRLVTRIYLDNRLEN